MKAIWKTYIRGLMFKEDGILILLAYWNTLLFVGILIMIGEILRRLGIFVILITLCFACKKKDETPIRMNLVDTYSGRYVDNLQDTLIISLNSTSPDKNTYILKGLVKMVKKQFGDSTMITGTQQTGYATKLSSIYIDNCALGSDGLSYIKFNNPNYLGYGTYSRTLIKLP